MAPQPDEEALAAARAAYSVDEDALAAARAVYDTPEPESQGIPLPQGSSLGAIAELAGRTAQGAYENPGMVGQSIVEASDYMARLGEQPLTDLSLPVLDKPVPSWLDVTLRTPARVLTDPARVVSSYTQGVMDYPWLTQEMPQEMADQAGILGNLAKPVFDTASTVVGGVGKVVGGGVLAAQRAFEPIQQAYETGQLDATGLAARTATEMVVDRLAKGAKGAWQIPAEMAKPIAQAIAGEYADMVATGQYGNISQYPERALNAYQRFLELAGAEWFGKVPPVKNVKEKAGNLLETIDESITEGAKTKLVPTERPAFRRAANKKKLITVEVDPPQEDVYELIRNPSSAEIRLKNKANYALEWAEDEIGIWDDVRSGEDIHAKVLAAQKTRQDAIEQIMQKAEVIPDGNPSDFEPPGAKEYQLRKAIKDSRTLTTDATDRLVKAPVPEAFKDIQDFVNGKTFKFSGAKPQEAIERLDFILDTVYGKADRQSIEAAVDRGWLTPEAGQKYLAKKIDEVGAWVPDEMQGPEGRIYNSYSDPAQLYLGKEKAPATAIKPVRIQREVAEVPMPYTADLPTIYQMIRDSDVDARSTFIQGKPAASQAFEQTIGIALRKHAKHMEDQLVATGKLSSSEVEALRQARTELHLLHILEPATAMSFSTSSASKNVAENYYGIGTKLRQGLRENTAHFVDPNLSTYQKVKELGKKTIESVPLVGPVAAQPIRSAYKSSKTIAKTYGAGMKASRLGGQAIREYDELPDEYQFPRESERFFRIDPEVLAASFPNDMPTIEQAINGGPKERVEALRQISKSNPKLFAPNPLGIKGYNFIDGKVDPEQAPILRENLLKLMKRPNVDRNRLSKIINAISADERIIGPGKDKPTAPEIEAVTKALENYLIANSTPQ